MVCLEKKLPRIQILVKYQYWIIHYDAWSLEFHLYSFPNFKHSYDAWPEDSTIGKVEFTWHYLEGPLSPVPLMQCLHGRKNNPYKFCLNDLIGLKSQDSLDWGVLYSSLFILCLMIVPKWVKYWWWDVNTQKKSNNKFPNYSTIISRIISIHVMNNN